MAFTYDGGISFLVQFHHRVGRLSFVGHLTSERQHPLGPVGYWQARKKKENSSVSSLSNIVSVLSLTGLTGAPPPHQRRRTAEPSGALARELLWDISRGESWTYSSCWTLPCTFSNGFSFEKSHATQPSI